MDFNHGKWIHRISEGKSKILDLGHDSRNYDNFVILWRASSAPVEQMSIQRVAEPLRAL
jgi:hypothetical protein